MSFTRAQQEAIAARGNVLVVAGAGTGKTSTLVERCLDCLLHDRPRASLDEILMVTFTDAAAAEMRQRIRARLEETLAADPKDLHWPEQLALFEMAHIGTLHSFCLQLLRQHFYELELDPQLSVMAEEESALLADEILETIFQEHYAEKTPAAAAVQRLIQTQARGRDEPIRALVLQLHHYTQTLRDPQEWVSAQLEMFRSDEPKQWFAWLARGFDEWRNRWLPMLQTDAPENQMAAACARILQQLAGSTTGEAQADALKQINAIYDNCPHGKATSWRKPLEHFFAEAFFLRSLVRRDGVADPLAQDWEWVRHNLVTLLELTREFTRRFSEAKREMGSVDFHDLEQHALRLLRDPVTHQPTATTRHWRKKLRYIFVDEYQDINEAQDAILEALSGEGPAANRFLVGDVKQSIYRFRLADPHIFLGYIESWRNSDRVIPLVDNFRSRESILHFINSLFGAVMRRELGSVPYDDEARLNFGDREHRLALSLEQNPIPAVELHLRLKSAGTTDSAESEAEPDRALSEIANLEEAAKEARLVALRLRELKQEGHPIWDDSLKAMRPAGWGDMAVLLRSPAGKMESYAREFARLGVPLSVSRGGFYDSIEIMDLLSLLQLLDNPLQDLPALAVLHSPLVGMTLDELAAIRLTLPKGHFWTALLRFHETNRQHSGWGKADRFLNNFKSWRRLARQVSLSRCLEAVLSGTHYADWLLTQSRGEQRHANVQRLLALAQQFDQFQRQGLFRFLRFIEAQQAAETEPQVASVTGQDSVALMSIHQSKGLEFPVVVAADLGKSFNLSDLKAEIILDPEYGLCPQVKPPHTGRRYPSLPYWLARQRQKQESLGEELRLLYVAMTRARDTLILTGTLSEKQFEKKWQQSGGLTTPELLGARNYLDWIAAWSANTIPISDKSGQSAFWRWHIYDDLDQRLLDENASTVPVKNIATEELDADSWQALRGRLTWQYPHEAATHEPAKTSVSAVRRRLAQESDEDAIPLFKFQKLNLNSQIPRRTRSGKLSAADIGTAHHTFLQMVSLEKTGSIAALREEAQRMLSQQVLSLEETRALDFDAIAAFWQSELGTKIRAQAKHVRRELAFTARFSPAELFIEPNDPTATSDGEFVVLQGVADLVVLLPEEIWLVDFKTDQLKSGELPEKIKLYEPQLQLYAQALNRLFRQPVSQICIYFLELKHPVMLEMKPAS